MHKVTERLAEDHDLWAKHFLDAFEKMIQNGYDQVNQSIKQIDGKNLINQSNEYDQEELQDGPVNSWFGHHTLSGNLIWWMVMKAKLRGCGFAKNGNDEQA